MFILITYLLTTQAQYEKDLLTQQSSLDFSWVYKQAVIALYLFQASFLKMDYYPETLHEFKVGVI